MLVGLLDPHLLSRKYLAGGASSSIDAPASLNYLAVRLKAGKSWHHKPALDHTVGWVSLSTSRVRVPESVAAGELAIFESSTQAIDFHADTDTEFVLGSAAPHGHDLVLGQYSCIPASPHCARPNGGSRRSTAGCRVKVRSHDAIAEGELRAGHVPRTCRPLRGNADVLGRWQTAAGSRPGA